MEKNMKNIKAEFKANGIFYTPPELAETIKSYVDFEPRKVYDPTAGQGNLLAVFDDNVEKYGQELYADELEKANQRLNNFHGYCGDTLADDGFPDDKFDLIVANPPFSVKWTPNEGDIRWKDAPCIPSAGKADYAFLLHILYHLSDDGKAVCLEFPGILYRGQREGKIRQWMVEQNFIERVVQIPGNTFVDTAIATCILVLNKHKTTTDIIFEDKELHKEKVVPFDEVKAQGFNLSVSSYVYKEEVREKIDPIALEMQARELAVKRIENEIRFSQLVAAQEGLSIEPFLDAIEAVVRKYRTTCTAKGELP
jgi:type I restriction enzyme M protein